MVAYGAPSAWGRMASTLKGTGTAVAWQIRPATAMPVNIGARSIMDCYISMRTRDTGFFIGMGIRFQLVSLADVSYEESPVVNSGFSVGATSVEVRSIVSLLDGNGFFVRSISFLILGGGYVRFRRFIHVSGCDNNAYRSQCHDGHGSIDPLPTTKVLQIIVQAFEQQFPSRVGSLIGFLSEMKIAEESSSKVSW